MERVKQIDKRDKVQNIHVAPTFGTNETKIIPVKNVFFRLAPKIFSF